MNFDFYRIAVDGIPPQDFSASQLKENECRLTLGNETRRPCRSFAQGLLAPPAGPWPITPKHHYRNPIACEPSLHSLPNRVDSKVLCCLLRSASTLGGAFPGEGVRESSALGGCSSDESRDNQHTISGLATSTCSNCRHVSHPSIFREHG